MKKRKLERGIAGLLVVVMMLSMVPLAAVPAWAAPAELFFSEYIEGSSYSKALEVYNGTGGAIDLAAVSDRLGQHRWTLWIRWLTNICTYITWCVPKWVSAKALALLRILS